jgi:hypothetical protein
MFVSSQNSYVEILTSNMMVLTYGAFGSWLGHEGMVLRNGISDLNKSNPENPLVPSTMWGHNEKTVVREQGSSPSRGTESVSALILDF